MSYTGTVIRSLLALPLISFAAGAGTQHPGAIRMADPEEAPAIVSSDGIPHFGCETRFFDISKNKGRVPCYNPYSIRKAYGLDELIASGADGTGQTIVILDAFGSPTAAADLQAFDAVFGIPDPNFSIVTMPGTPPFDPHDGNMVGWAEETSLDVQWSHAIAPGANIVLVEAASNNDSDLIAGLNYALDHHLGNVVSMSFGESEAFLTDKAGRATIHAWEAAFRKAHRQHVTLFVSSGDQGSTNTADGAGDVFPFRNVSYPASSIRVTAVGGTNLFFGTGNGRASYNGSYLGEQVWNDEPQGIGAAGGGGISALFEIPDYQAEDFERTHAFNHHRGVPDVAYNAGVVGGVIVRLGFFGGFFVFGGTSAGAPQWSGVIADVNQLIGKPSGFINNRLYQLGRSGLIYNLFHDVTAGDNGFCFFTVPNGDFACVPGFSAGPGYDFGTGWGTPNVGRLAAILSSGDADDHGDGGDGDDQGD